MNVTKNNFCNDEEGVGPKREQAGGWQVAGRWQAGGRHGEGLRKRARAGS